MKSGYGRYAILGALLLALVAGVANMKYLESLQQKQKIVVVTRTVQAFEKLESDALSEVLVPVGELTVGAIASIEQAKGQYTRALLVKGQVLRKDHLEQSGTGSLAARLTQAKQDNVGSTNISAGPGAPGAGEIRAMALKVSADTGVAQTIQPGDEVDLLIVLKLDNGSTAKSYVSKIVATRVPVLYTTFQQKAETLGGTTIDATVVLQVTRAQAEELAFAQVGGTIWLLTAPYRSKSDQPEAATTGVTLEEFVRRHDLGKPTPPTPAKGATP